MAWRTTDDAEYDLQVIAEQGLIQFGPRVARNYTIRLLEMFDALADHPEMGSLRQAATVTVRLMPCGSHNILYAAEDGDIIILRVLHGLQDWFDLL